MGVETREVIGVEQISGDCTDSALSRRPSWLQNEDREALDKSALARELVVLVEGAGEGDRDWNWL